MSVAYVVSNDLDVEILTINFVYKDTVAFYVFY